MIHRDFELALRSPLETAHGDIDSRQGFLVGIGEDPSWIGGGQSGTREGQSGISEGQFGNELRGIGEATPLAGWTESLATCRSALEAFQRVDADHPGEALASLTGMPAARHGVALALLDATARADDVGLADYLARYGDTVADTVPVNATIGIATPEETAARAEEAVEAGYECVKLKVGSDDLDGDIRRVQAVRRAVGEGVAIRLDANGSWAPATARRAIRRLSGVGVEYVEQPVAATELAAMADLRGRGVEIAADETLAAYDLGDVLDADAADVVVLKPMALGGPDRAIDAAMAARRAGVDAVVTTTIDAVVARTAAIHVAAAVPDVRPCGLATGDLLATDLAADPAPVVDGEIYVPDGPGVADSAFDHLLESS